MTIEQINSQIEAAIRVGEACQPGSKERARFAKDLARLKAMKLVLEAMTPQQIEAQKKRASVALDAYKNQLQGAPKAVTREQRKKAMADLKEFVQPDRKRRQLAFANEIFE